MVFFLLGVEGWLVAGGVLGLEGHGVDEIGGKGGGGATMLVAGAGPSQIYLLLNILTPRVKPQVNWGPMPPLGAVPQIQPDLGKPFKEGGVPTTSLELLAQVVQGLEVLLVVGV